MSPDPVAAWLSAHAPTRCPPAALVPTTSRTFDAAERALRSAHMPQTAHRVGAADPVVVYVAPRAWYRPGTPAAAQRAAYRRGAQLSALLAAGLTRETLDRDVRGGYVVLSSSS